MKRVACVMTAMALALMPFRSLCMSAEPEPLKRVVTIDTIEDQTVRLMVYLGLVDEAGDFDGDGLSDAVFVANDFDYYLLYGQDGLWGRLLDSQALRATTGDIRLTRFIVPIEAPNRLAVGGGGDVNGDGLDDIVLGAAEGPFCPEGCHRNYDRAVFYVILGQMDGLPREADVESLLSAGKAAILQPPDSWVNWMPDWVSIEFMGDMNGDGYGEVGIAGGLDDIEGIVAAGGVFVLFGSRNLGGRRIELAEVGRNVPGLRVSGSRTWEQIGEEMEGLGDIDGDGYDDIGLYAGPGSGFPVRQFIVYGGRDLGGQYNMEGLPQEWRALLHGYSKAGRLGDMNGDGIDDFAVAGDNGQSCPTVVVVDGGLRLRGELSSQTLDATANVSRISNEHPVPRAPLYRLGAIHGGVDVNRDGMPEFCYYSGGAAVSGAGRSIIVLGREEFPDFVSYDDLLESYAFAIEGVQQDGGLGRPTLPLYDFEGDGFGDLVVVGSWWPSVIATSYIVPWRSLVSRSLGLNVVEPNSGSRLGGDLVTLRGSDFGPEMEVLFGESGADVVDVVSEASVVVRTPAHEVGTVDVSVGKSGRWVTLERAFSFDDRYTRTVDLRRISQGDGREGVEIHFSGSETYVRSGELIRDVNGDGRPEIGIVSDPQDAGSGNFLYVIFGGKRLPAYVDLSSAENHWDVRMRSSADLEILGLIGSGDMDGDGVGDMALRARRPGNKEEQLLVVCGRGDFVGEMVVDQMDRVTGVRITNAPCETQWLGDATVSPDIDGDGLDDILAGYAGDSCGGGGGVIVYGSRRFGREPELSVEDMLPLGEAARIHGASGLTGGGDVDGNGRREMALAGGLEVTLFDLRDGRLTGSCEVADVVLTGVPCRGFQLVDLPIYLADVAFPGDLNGDGKADLVIGTLEGKQNTPTNAGAVNIISGAFTREGVCEDVALWTNYAREIVGDRIRAMLGWRLARAGDWNGDGFEDLLVGAPGYHQDRFPEVDGVAYILYGSPTILQDELKLYDLREKGVRFTGAKPGWWIGEKVSGGQDFNGDGIDDVLLTEYSYPSGKETGASAYLVYGRSSEIFRRGDANADGAIDLGDPIFILNFLFANGKRPACLDSADIDDSGDLTIGDPIYLLQYLYSGGPEPKEPFQPAGPDPTTDGLFCAG